MFFCCAKKTAQEFLKTSPSNAKIVVRFAKPIFQATYATVRWLTRAISVLLVLDVLLALYLFITAIQIRRHIGFYINMISSGDGNTLSSLQAVPALFCLLVNLAMIYLLYRSFAPEPNVKVNRLMYVCVLVASILTVALLVIVIFVFAHSYGEHEHLHDGIVVAMRNYSTNPMYKSLIDRLQIDLQCCGSKNYDEWYEIMWYDPSLTIEGTSSPAEGNTPFSCCSMSSMFPCIHHKLEITGRAYLYVPEENLSISQNGCYEIIREIMQNVGSGIVGHLFLFTAFQGATVALFRFIQTAHFETSQFDGDTRIYTIWLFGCYTGKVKSDGLVDVPTPPPVPPELADQLITRTPRNAQ